MVGLPMKIGGDAAAAPGGATNTHIEVVLDGEGTPCQLISCVRDLKAYVLVHPGAARRLPHRHAGPRSSSDSRRLNAGTLRALVVQGQNKKDSSQTVPPRAFVGTGTDLVTRWTSQHGICSIDLLTNEPATFGCLTSVHSGSRRESLIPTAALSMIHTG